MYPYVDAVFQQFVGSINVRRLPDIPSLGWNWGKFRGVRAAYKSGALTATQLVQGYLKRIQAYDQAGPKLNVVIFGRRSAAKRLAWDPSRKAKRIHRKSPNET
jgi:hypothetical protein